MNAYKNVGGEKAYIGNISYGLAEVIFCHFFKDPRYVYEKVKKSYLDFQNIEVSLICSEWGLNVMGERVIDPTYGAKIIGVPAEAALNLPDWKEPL